MKVRRSSRNDKKEGKIRMKVLFLGTDEFAIPSLEAIVEKHEVIAVITQPEKPKGRGRKVAPTPVKTAAERLGIPVMEPENLRKKHFRNELGELEYEVVVLAAYGKILPESFLEKPEKGCVCIHPSLLPEYRGCSPIETAIMEGKDKTGISVFFIDREIDTGDVICQEEFNISSEDTGGTLRERLARESPHIILKALDDIENNRVEPVGQDGCRACYSPKYCREDALINWTDSAERINNMVRAFNPKPGAYTCFRNGILKIQKSAVIESESENKNVVPGTIAGIIKNKGIEISCGNNRLLLLEVQPEGKKSMNAWAFVVGHHPEIGEKLGDNCEYGEGNDKEQGSVD
jgi:methionyl-tRNA formyltransferase